MGTIETFILFQNTAKQRFQNAYEYEFAGQVFTKNSLIFVVCPKHGKYKTVAHRYLKAKHGCKFCYRQSCLNKSIQKIDTKSFIEKAILVHGNEYDYSLSKYINNHKKIKIVCKHHGVFEQTPGNHLSGYKCRKCTNEFCGKKSRKTTQQYINEAKAIHGDIYGYELVDYQGAHKKIWIVCQEHGPFETKAHNHLQNGSGCPRCANHTSSKSATQWLNLLDIPRREYWIPNTKYRVDGFDPKTNTVYEYLGMYWHGHPDYFNPKDINLHTNKTFGDLYQETLDRLENIKSLGYNVVVKWEETTRPKLSSV